MRAITTAHVRNFKTSLLATTGRTGRTLSPATVKKDRGALASVLSWAKPEGYVSINVGEGITVATGKGVPEDWRLPYDTDDLAIRLDPAANVRGGPRITTADSAVSAWAIPTNEELMIARQTLASIRG